MKVMRSVIIDAPIETVWSAIRQFDAVVNWNPGVSAATLESGNSTEVGAIRLLDIVDGSQFRETLLAHSDRAHFYTYDIVDSPLDCQNYIATHGLIEITDGNRTLSYWRGEFDCTPENRAELEQIVGQQIYHEAQVALNTYLQELK
ncbi:MAG: SRPBCC family protein [Pseudomonadota bacterium]